MIWIDASFAIEWLLGTAKAAEITLPRTEKGILPAQYSEILVYFGRRVGDLSPVIEQLEALKLEHPNKGELQEAAQIYLQAKKQKSKASLVDAMLAAVAIKRNESLLSFDSDFADLGLKNSEGVWSDSD